VKHVFGFFPTEAPHWKGEKYCQTILVKLLVATFHQKDTPYTTQNYISLSLSSFFLWFYLCRAATSPATAQNSSVIMDWLLRYNKQIVKMQNSSRFLDSNNDNIYEIINKI
jgi:hypothetical protein